MAWHLPMLLHGGTSRPAGPLHRRGREAGVGGTSQPTARSSTRRRCALTPVGPHSRGVAARTLTQGKRRILTVTGTDRPPTRVRTMRSTRGRSSIRKAPGGGTGMQNITGRTPCWPPCSTATQLRGKPCPNALPIPLPSSLGCRGGSTRLPRPPGVHRRQPRPGTPRWAAPPPPPLTPRPHTPAHPAELTVLAALGDALRAAQVEVHAVDVALHQPGSGQQRVGVVGAELGQQGAVLRKEAGAGG